MTESTILITGSNRGIGLKLTERFAEHGWRVLACCRNPSAAAELQALAERYPAIEIEALDVTDYAQMAELAARLRERPIDILLSNAGVLERKGSSFGELDPAAWRRVLEVNTIAPAMLAQAFVEQVAASERKLIAVISSKVGSIDDNRSGGSYLYRSSKTAVNQVVKCLSIDLATRGIGVISLHPGWVRTDMGGPDGEIDTDESAAGLERILQSATLAESGRFIEYDGEPIPW